MAAGRPPGAFRNRAECHSSPNRAEAAEMAIKAAVAVMQNQTCNSGPFIVLALIDFQRFTAEAQRTQK